MRIIVDGIVSQRPYGIIFAGTAVDLDGLSVRVRADLNRLLGVPSVGDTWEIEGDLRKSPYGRQMDARAGHRLLSSGHLVKQFLASHVPGIGPTRAERLWEAYGENLPEVLSTDDLMDEIAAIVAPDRPALARRLAGLIVNTWRSARSEAALVAWLDRQGVRDVALVRRLHRILGDDAMETVAANPYVMVPLMRWDQLDDLGRRLLSIDGKDASRDVRRIVGAADETVKRMLRRGDTAASRQDLTEDLMGLLGIGTDSDVAVSVALTNGAVVESGDAFRAPGAAALEDDLRLRLATLLEKSEETPQTAQTASRWSEELTDAAPIGTTLHADQSAAVAGVLSRSLSCLVGGAGTGKTYTCRMICDVWARRGGNVLLGALAGKAALRLSRSTGRLARTLARILAELAERDELEAMLADPDTSEAEARKATSKLEGLSRITEETLVVVDEASMVDLPTVHALVRRLCPGSRLLLVGDPAQLPPIGFGLVFHKLVSDPAVTRRLTHVHRQAAETGIPAVAEAIRDGLVPGLGEFRGIGRGVSFVDARDDGIAGALDDVVERLDDGSESLIVTATIKGPAGVEAVNERLHRRYVSPGREEFKGPFGRRFAVGEPVIFGRNDYGAGLFNGLLGRVASLDFERHAVHVQFDGDPEPKIVGSEHLPDLDLAYAVTCHKAQGSSAKRVVVPIYASRVMDRSWLYTAVTRAEEQVVLVGDRVVLQSSIARPPAAETRKVGFRWP